MRELWPHAMVYFGCVLTVLWAGLIIWIPLRCFCDFDCDKRDAFHLIDTFYPITELSMKFFRADGGSSSPSGSAALGLLGWRMKRRSAPKMR